MVLCLGMRLSNWTLTYGSGENLEDVYTQGHVICPTLALYGVILP